MSAEWEFNRQTKDKGAVAFFTFEATKEEEKDTSFSNQSAQMWVFR